MLRTPRGDNQTVRLDSVAGYADVVSSLDRIERTSGGLVPDAQRIRDALTVVVIPMYNPDDAEANIRQSTTPTRIDLNRDWEDFAQQESVAFWHLWRTVQPELALDLHHMSEAPTVEGTNDLNQFQIGALSIDPARMTAEQWLTNRQMAMVSVDALDRFGPVNVARYPASTSPTRSCREC